MSQIAVILAFALLALCWPFIRVGALIARNEVNYALFRGWLWVSLFAERRYKARHLAMRQELERATIEQNQQ